MVAWLDVVTLPLVVPGCDGTTITFTMIDFPLARLPTPHTTLPEPPGAHEPEDPVGSKLTPAGSVWTTRTPLAESDVGPRLVTVRR